MTVNCQWIDQNIDAIFSDRLAPEESKLSRAHIGTCDRCKKEVQALLAIDPLIKKYFQSQLHRAMVPQSSKVVAVGRRMAWSVTAVGGVAVILLAVVLRNAPIDPVATGAVQQQADANMQEPVLKDYTTAVERAKPSDTGGSAPIVPSAEPDPTAPGFLVTDPAGYSHSLEDFRGFRTVIGFWSVDQPASIENMERLYKAFGSNPRLRFVGVAAERVPKPANTTFPIFYSQGSASVSNPGEFILLDENGNVRERGSLTADFERLSKALQ